MARVRRPGTIWSVAVALVVGTASLTAAATPTLGEPATVRDRAQRLDPTYEPELTPEERVVHEMVTLVNVERARRGLAAYRLDDLIGAAARAHAADMAANRRMQHAGSDGSDGGTRLDRAGYVWAAWGENIGAGFGDPRSLLDSWMRSSVHRANVLGDYTDVGVGAVASADGVPYWTLLVALAPY